jgi:Transcription factor WhiB
VSGGIEHFRATEFAMFFFASLPTFYREAECTKMGFDGFFPSHGQASLARKAIKICQQCDVRYECLEYALQQKIEDGVWGGTTATQRKKFIAKNMDVEEVWLSLGLK